MFQSFMVEFLCSFDSLKLTRWFYLKDLGIFIFEKISKNPLYFVYFYWLKVVIKRYLIGIISKGFTEVVIWKIPYIIDKKRSLKNIGYVAYFNVRLDFKMHQEYDKTSFKIISHSCFFMLLPSIGRSFYICCSYFIFLMYYFMHYNNNNNTLIYVTEGWLLNRGSWFALSYDAYSHS